MDIRLLEQKKLSNITILIVFCSLYIIICSIKKVVIFDVGANKGQTIKRFQKVFENNLFFCFEPTKRICQKLKENFLHKKNIKIFNFGI